MRLPSIAALVFFTLSAPIPSFARPPAAQTRSYSSSCGSDSYINSRGNCVHRPVQASSAPYGASAKCRDGSYSFSQSRRGTCSHHGGVGQWL